MVPPIIFEIGTDAAGLADALDAERGQLVSRQFPDGETYVRVESVCEERPALIVADLSRPDARLAELLFTLETVRDLGARQVGLVAPYLAYMRQDERFHPGEGLTSRYFARLLSRYIDWLVTVDPHLHRHDTLSDIYDVPTHTVASAPSVARWLDRFEEPLLLVGPDEESQQWVEAVARLADLPFVIFAKERSGDREVDIAASGLAEHRDRLPIIIDDIISTGQTMVTTAERLTEQGLAQPVCVGVHALFSDEGCQGRLTHCMRQVVTCNTIAHDTNAIDVTGRLAEAVRLALAPDWEGGIAPTAPPLR